MESFVIPSLIARTQEELDARIAKVKSAVSLFQLDVMDGQFVPNTSLDFEFEVPSGYRYEAHLMVDEPEDWIERNSGKVQTILVHYESCDDLDNMHQLVGTGKRFGIALNPETPVDVLEDYLDKLDMVLIMTVHPGFYGSPFLPEMLAKVKALREHHPELDIEVDGGMNYETIKLAHTAGANMFVVGSYLMEADDIGKTMKKLMDWLNKM